MVVLENGRGKESTGGVARGRGVGICSRRDIPRFRLITASDSS